MKPLRAMLAALAAAAAAMTINQPLAEETADGAGWYVIEAHDGARLGYASLATHARDGDREIVREQQLFFQEARNQPTHVRTRSARIENEAGEAVSIVTSVRSGEHETRTETRIAQGLVEVVRITPSGRTVQSMPIAAGMRFDEGDGLLPAWDPAASPRLEFEDFNIGAMASEHVVIEALGAPDAEGRIRAMRTRYRDGGLVGIARLVLDRNGRLIETVQPMFGASVHVRASDRETATRTHQPYRMVPNFMIRSPFRISEAGLLTHVRYRFAFEDEFTFTPPQTDEQRVRMEEGAFTLDICADCGPGLATDDAALAAALRPTSMLQSDHPRLIEMAAAVTRAEPNAARKMELLQHRARATLQRLDYSGHFSALDTLDRRAGDCTEAAVLLAALGRAAGIPTRVANGLAYSRESYHGVANAFVPHSWVIAYVDGRWQSFDAAFERFDSGHIVLTIGDGDASSISAAGQLASLLRLETIAEVRPRD
ncbi:MAG: transglutaminase-like domain-containing protein [Terricaulis sp.]